jgi:hypothetical protein
VGGRLVLRGEDAGAFHRDIDVHLAPGQLGGVALGQDPDGPASDAEPAVHDRDLVREAAVDRIVLQQVRVDLHVAQVVDGDHLDILAPGFIDRAHHQPPDPPEAVDRHPNRH